MAALIILIALVGVLCLSLYKNISAGFDEGITKLLLEED